MRRLCLKSQVHLISRGFNISDEDISYGLSHTSWAARFEFVSDRVVIDGGHNIDGIKALKKSLLSLNRDIVLVIAMMEDKDYKACIREISPVAKLFLRHSLICQGVFRPKKFPILSEV